MTILQLALLGITLFWQGQMATILEELPSVPLHRCCSELLHIYQTFSSIHFSHLFPTMVGGSTVLECFQHCQCLTAEEKRLCKTLNNSF